MWFLGCKNKWIFSELICSLILCTSLFLRITFCHLPFQSKWLYIGSERGNIHIVNVESFTLSGYTIMWNKAIELWVIHIFKIIFICKPLFQSDAISNHAWSHIAAFSLLPFSRPTWLALSPPFFTVLQLFIQTFCQQFCFLSRPTERPQCFCDPDRLDTHTYSHAFTGVTSDEC